MKMKELVQEGWKLLDITNDEKIKAEYDSWCRKVKGFLNQNGFPKGKLNEIQIKMWYTENEFSKDDGFYYKAKTVFFFVYDKKNIIKNPDVFKAAFVREQEKSGKNIKVIVLQPVEL